MHQEHDSSYVKQKDRKFWREKNMTGSTLFSLFAWYAALSQESRLIATRHGSQNDRERRCEPDLFLILESCFFHYFSILLLLDDNAY